MSFNNYVHCDIKTFSTSLEILHVATPNPVGTARRKRITQNLALGEKFIKRQILLTGGEFEE